MPQKSTFSNTIPHYTNLSELNKLILKAYNITVIYARSRPKKPNRQPGNTEVNQLDKQLQKG